MNNEYTELSDKISVDLSGCTFVDYDHVVSLLEHMSIEELANLSNLIDDLLDQ